MSGVGTGGREVWWWGGGLVCVCVGYGGHVYVCTSDLRDVDGCGTGTVWWW